MTWQEFSLKNSSGIKLSEVKPELFTIEEVKQMKEKETETIIKRQIIEINADIIKAVNSNHSKISLPPSIHEKVISDLKENGFEVKEMDGIKGELLRYEISW